jgi:hypothetical protein
MVSDQEIASCVESVLRGSAGGPAEASLAAVLQQAEAKLGMDLSHKAMSRRQELRYPLFPFDTFCALGAPIECSLSLGN